MKNKIVASDLIEERKKCTFDKKELKTILMGGVEEEKIWDYHRELFV
jgi:hypothetical protein